MGLGRVGKYELLEKLSEGGMGELFRARTEGPGGFERVVALKRIRGQAVSDPNFVRMFVEEAKVASLLSHQNLVHLYDFGSEGDVHFLAMEMVEGRDLAHVLARAREVRLPLSIGVSVRVALEVAQGLDHLHRLRRKGERLQLIHRDVSPQNIMLSYDGAVKLTDFGIVRVNRQERTTAMGVLKGKIGYLAPEQVMDVPLDGRVDLFSLGIVLWECLTGARLFPGRTDLELITQTLQRPIRPPSALNGEVSQALDAIVLKALSRDRDGRYAASQELVQALAALPELGSTEEVAQAMRQLFPEGARTRELSLATSAGLVKVEASEVRKFLGSSPDDTVEAPALDTSPERASVRMPEETERSGPVLPAPGDEIPTAPRPQRQPSRWPLLIGGGLTLCAAVAGGSWALLGRRQTPQSVAPPPTVAADPAPAAVLPPLPVPSPAEPAPAPAPKPTPTPPAAAEAKPAPKVTSRKAASGQTGAIAVIQATPWAAVAIDGKGGRFSPGRWPVAAGRHRITLSNPELGIERRFEVEVAAGKTVLFTGPLNSLQPQSEE